MHDLAAVQASTMIVAHRRSATLSRSMFRLSFAPVSLASRAILARAPTLLSRQRQPAGGILRNQSGGDSQAIGYTSRQ